MIIPQTFCHVAAMSTRCRNYGSVAQGSCRTTSQHGQHLLCVSMTFQMTLRSLEVVSSWPIVSLQLLWFLTTLIPWIGWPRTPAFNVQGCGLVNEIQTFPANQGDHARSYMFLRALKIKRRHRQGRPEVIISRGVA